MFYLAPNCREPLVDKSREGSSGLATEEVASRLFFYCYYYGAPRTEFTACRTSHVQPIGNIETNLD